jgi:hypothetical protein
MRLNKMHHVIIMGTSTEGGRAIVKEGRKEGQTERRKAGRKDIKEGRKEGRKEGH